MSLSPPSRKKVTPPEKKQRLNRFLSRCGLCSRREADRWIGAGRVRVNGRPVTDMGVQVGPDDKVEVDGKTVSVPAARTYMLYHKPRGLICSRKDNKGRPLIYDQLDVAANVQSVGRLDMDSEGLLLLTDDGDLARQLTHPSAKIPRTYRVRITGHLAMEALQHLRTGGVDIGRSEKSAPWDLIADSESRGHSWITITIKRGRWREVRRTLKALGHDVRRLIRTRFGPIELGDLPRSASRSLKAAEIRRLQETIRSRH